MGSGLALAGALNSPLRFMFGISSAAWEAAVNSLAKHWDHPKIERPFLMTLIDFTRPAKDRRLWTFNVILHVPYFYTPVAHGKNSGGAGAPATVFSNTPGSNKSCLGGFATHHATHKSNLGGVSGTGLKVHGLDSGMNNKAYNRGILFHGASYVKPSGAGRSLGCFATIPEVNERLLPLIAGGSFVYAWGGESPKVD